MKRDSDYWGEIVGQPRAVSALQHVLSPEGSADLAHAWLITGPPGSGRSNLAYRFAAALIARDEKDREQVYRQVIARTHPDIDVLTTEGVSIKISDARNVATRAYYAPTTGRYRVIIAEDADRLPERSSNTILKALEEPAERTVWILCAPSEADMLPTIRSRTRSLRLQTPAVEEVAKLLASRDGIDYAAAERAARLAQSHIGMARKLATDDETLARRTKTLDLVLGIETLSDAMFAAVSVVKLADEDAKALTLERDEVERVELLRNMGFAQGETVPLKMRKQVRDLEEDQKRRARRSVQDAVDRFLIDLTALFRDILMLQLDAKTDLINREFEPKIAEWAELLNAEDVTEAVNAVETARSRLTRNITPGLVIEALFASIIVIRSGAKR